MLGNQLESHTQNVDFLRHIERKILTALYENKATFSYALNLYITMERNLDVLAKVNKQVSGVDPEIWKRGGLVWQIG